MLKYAIPILLLATSGSQAQCQPGQYQPKVEIQLGKGSTANPDPACVAGRGFVRWCSTEGDWSVSFPRDTPQDSPFPKGHAKHAGKKDDCSHWDQVNLCKRPDRKPCPFPYTSEVKGSGSIDPTVEVEPER